MKAGHAMGNLGNTTHTDNQLFM